jgi:hypothetical protein
MKKLYLTFIFIFLVLNISKTKAAEPYYFYSPGVRLGYQFGDNGGFVYGFEFSIVKTESYYPTLGGKLSIDFCKGNTKLHLGGLVAYIAGIDIGPTIYFSDKKTNFGYSVGLYGLVFIMPFYEYTKMFDEQNFSINQAGTFLILPIPSRPYRLNLAH